MRSPALAVMYFLLFLSCAVVQGGVEGFAQRLRKIVVSGDTAALRVLTCYPASCIDDENTAFVMGSEGQSSFIRDFLANPNVRLKVFGPYTYADELGDKSYVIMFFDPQLVRFNDDGSLSQEQRENLWWRGYVETVVSPVDAGWGFHRTPFYYGTEPPWMNDF